MLKHLVRGLMVGLACAAAFGCSGDDDDDGSTQPDPAAVAKCEDFLAAYSLTIIDCGVAGGLIPDDERDAQLEELQTEAAKTVDCSRTVSVSSTYDACMDWLRDPDCDMVLEGLASMGETLPFPDECSGVIRIF